MDRDRRQKAQKALSENQTRHQDIQELEKQFIKLMQLFKDMEELVIQQEPAIQNIEQQGEQVEGNVGRAVVHLEGAVTSAGAARRKKWICLGIAGKLSHPRNSNSPSHQLQYLSSSSLLLWSWSWCCSCGGKTFHFSIRRNNNLGSGILFLLHQQLRQRRQQPRGSKWSVIWTWILSRSDTMSDQLHVLGYTLSCSASIQAHSCSVAQVKNHGRPMNSSSSTLWLIFQGDIVQHFSVVNNCTSRRNRASPPANRLFNSDKGDSSTEIKHDKLERPLISSLRIHKLLR
jgi:SNARE domain